MDHFTDSFFMLLHFKTKMFHFPDNYRNHFICHNFFFLVFKIHKKLKKIVTCTRLVISINFCQEQSMNDTMSASSLI